MSRGEGFGIGFREVVGVVLLVGRVGGGVGTGKGTSKSMRKLCRNYPFAIYLLVSPQFIRKAPNVGAGASGIWEHREETSRPLHETMRLAEAWLM